MQGCLAFLVVLLLLSVWQYLLPPIAAGAVVVALVCLVNGSGSLTGLLVVPRTPDRWLRLIGRCDDDGRLRTIGDRYRSWRWAQLRPVPIAAVRGLVAGLAWGAVLAGALALIALPYGLADDLRLVLPTLVLGYGGAAARVAVVDTVMRQRADEFGLDAVTDELRRRRVPDFVDRVTPAAGAEPRLPGESAPSPPVLGSLSPQPRRQHGSSARQVRPAASPPAVPVAPTEQPLTAHPDPVAHEPLFVQTVRDMTRPPVVAPAVTTSHTRGKVTAAVPAVATCGSCGRAISAQAGCRCS